MIVDAFLGFNEIKLAEFRISYLSPYINHSIIGESRTTHSGVAKNLFFREWYEKLNPDLKTKISIVEIPLEKFSDSWEREIGSREFLAAYVKRKFPGAQFILSDLDEIPSTSQVKSLNGVTGIFHFTTPTFYRRVNWKLKDKHSTWSRGVCGSIELLQEENGGRFSSYPIIGGDPGVHLSYLGMSDTHLREKISSFAHTELSANRFAAAGIIEFCDYFKINHLGKSRVKGFGLFDIAESNTEDIKEHIRLVFSDLIDANDSTTPSFPRRFWASMRLSVFLARQPEKQTHLTGEGFATEIASFELAFHALLESIISILYFCKRILQNIIDRMKL